MLFVRPFLRIRRFLFFGRIDSKICAIILRNSLYSQKVRQATDAANLNLSILWRAKRMRYRGNQFAFAAV
jgi:hypothetical protein